MVLYHHWSSLIWHEEEGFPSNAGLSKKPKMTTSATLGLGKNCPHNKRILLLWTKLVVLYHHWSSLIWHEEEGFPSNVGLSKKPKMTTSATLSLGKNCPHNKPNKWYYITIGHPLYGIKRKTFLPMWAFPKSQKWLQLQHLVYEKIIPTIN